MYVISTERYKGGNVGEYLPERRCREVTVHTPQPRMETHLNMQKEYSSNTQQDIGVKSKAGRPKLYDI